MNFHIPSDHITVTSSVLIYRGNELDMTHDNGILSARSILALNISASEETLQKMRGRTHSLNGYVETKAWVWPDLLDFTHFDPAFSDQ
jgi:hypothetical protein